MRTPVQPWKWLEEMGHLPMDAVPAVWEQVCGPELARARHFLVPTDERAESVPCRDQFPCECHHRVVEHEPTRIMAACQCDEGGCRAFPIEPKDIAVWRADVRRLGREIASALQCQVKESEVDVRGAWQIGAFGGESLPVILMIQASRSRFEQALMELVLKLGKPFVVLSPTSDFLTANGQSMLARVNAGFFGLGSVVEVMESGRLVAPKKAGEIFSRFLPEMKEALTESESARVFRLFGELMGMGTELKASPARVFDLMVMKGRSQAEAAVACKCARSLITVRVDMIEGHFRMPIETLRNFASDLKERKATVKGDRYGGKRKGGREEEEADGSGWRVEG